MKRRFGLASALAVAIGTAAVLMATPASAAPGDPPGCFSAWVLTETSASGFCNGANVAYKEKVRCTDGRWYYGKATLGLGLPRNPLSTARCPVNRFVVQTGIDKI